MMASSSDHLSSPRSSASGEERNSAPSVTTSTARTSSDRPTQKPPYVTPVESTLLDSDSTNRLARGSTSTSSSGQPSKPSTSAAEHGEDTKTSLSSVKIQKGISGSHGRRSINETEVTDSQPSSDSSGTTATGISAKSKKINDETVRSSTSAPNLASPFTVTKGVSSVPIAERGSFNQKRRPSGDWKDSDMLKSTLPTSLGTQVLPTDDETRSVNVTAVRRRDRQAALLNILTWCYALAGLLFIILAVVMVIMMMLSRHKLEKRAAVETCKPFGCTLDMGEASLYWRVDPCDDFYSFVCGSDESDSIAAEGEHVSFSDKIAVAGLEEKVYAFIRGQPLKDTALEPLRSLLEECEDTNTIAAMGWDPFLRLMHDVGLSGFPMTPPVPKTPSVWNISARLQRKTGTVSLLRVGITSHPLETTGDVVLIGLPDVFLSETSSVDGDYILRFYTSVVEYSFAILRKEFFPQVHILNIARFASGVESLYQLHRDERPYLLGKLNLTSPFHELVVEALSGVSGITFSGENSEFITHCPTFVSQLVHLVHGTETHTVMNFLSVRLIVQISPFLPRSNTMDALTSLVYGKLQPAVWRWKLCLRVVEKAMSPLVHLASLYSLQLYENASMFGNFVTGVSEEFANGIHSAGELDNSSKSAISNAISMAQFAILSPPWLNNRNLIYEYVLDLPRRSVGMGLASYIKTHECNYVMSQSRGSSQRWSRSVFSSNCWHDPGSRTVYVPALLLTSTSSSELIPNMAEFPRVAFRIARCLFDMVVSETSTVGMYREQNEGGSSNDSIANHCSLSNPWQLDTLRDALVVHAAYNHFQTASATCNKGAARRLTRTTDINVGHLFYLCLLRHWCEASAESRTFQVRSRLDWNTALRNENGFHEQFVCPLGSPMNPKGHCSI